MNRQLSLSGFGPSRTPAPPVVVPEEVSRACAQLKVTERSHIGQELLRLYESDPELFERRANEMLMNLTQAVPLFDFGPQPNLLRGAF
jgi:hypothetical protein